MRLLTAILALHFYSFGTINSQIVFPDTQFYNQLPFFGNQFQYPFNTINDNRNVQLNNFGSVQQTTTTTNKPYNLQQPGYYQPYQPQIHNIQQATTTTNRPYNVRAPQQNGKRLSEQKCDEYSSKATMSTFAGSLGLMTPIHTINADQCDVSQGLIVGGVNAKAGEFPHMVAIGFKEEFGNAVSFRCGGSLISERFVLTAAHCKQAKRQPASLVRVGDLNLNSKENNLPELDIPIDSFIAHEQYRSDKQKYDIAVVRLTRDVPIGKFIRPACLMTPNNILHSNKVVATGWGLTIAQSYDTSDILQKVDLSLIPNKKCAEYFEDTEISVDNTQLCAGVLEGNVH